MKIKFNGKLRKISESGQAIFIPSKIRKEHDLEVGDSFVIELEKVDTSLLIKSYRCKACLNKFDSSDEYPECNICESKDLEVLE